MAASFPKRERAHDILMYCNCCVLPSDLNSFQLSGVSAHFLTSSKWTRWSIYFMEVLWERIPEKLTGCIRDRVCKRCQRAQCLQQMMSIWKPWWSGWAGSTLSLRSDHWAWASSVVMDSVQGRWVQVLIWGWTWATLYTSKGRKSSSFQAAQHHFLSNQVYKLGLDELADRCWNGLKRRENHGWVQGKETTWFVFPSKSQGKKSSGGKKLQWAEHATEETQEDIKVTY